MSSSNVCLTLMMGLPAAGKTTLCEQLMAVPQSSINFIHICFDKLVEKLNNENQKLKEEREKIVDQVDVLIKEGLKSPSKTIILIDDNNYLRSMRYSLFQIARKYEIGFGEFFLFIEVHDAIARDSQRPNPVGEEIIKKMAKDLEPPSRNFRKWENHSRKYDKTTLSLEKILADLLQFMDYPEKSIDKTKIPVTQSELHNLDLKLRQLVGVIIKNSAKETSYVQQITEKRKKVLSEVKAGNLPLENAVEEFESSINF